MAKPIALLIIMLSVLSVSAQENIKNDTLKLDLDFDNKIDTVVFDRTKVIIICKLSTQNFKNIQSKELAFEEPQSNIRETGNGFTYSVPWMRAGYHMDFAYNKTAKKVQLVAMDRYEFGPANNDGSGESNINLITNEYLGDWNYYDLKREELIKIPTIKRKMIFPKTYLDNFDDKIAYEYAEKCATIFNAEKTRLINSSTKKKHNYVWSNYYPFTNKNFIVSIKKTEEIAESEIYYLEKKGSSTKLISKEKIIINQPKSSVAYQDFNGDGIKDFLVFSTTGARGNNEFYYLYLVNPKMNSLTKINDFEKIVNPMYNEKYKVIIAYGYSGTNNYSIYKILTNNKAVQIGQSFEDDFDGDSLKLNQKIEAILKKTSLK
ncbi:XAC2610-related protein [Pedobacter jamesrossensis]|uniref:XAC2610-related protein n=1 Tax=Pedobacter jamesrossensis TaxID=1908238 RepID=A0ABV8NIL7_9SPHI